LDNFGLKINLGIDSGEIQRIKRQIEDQLKIILPSGNIKIDKLPKLDVELNLSSILKQFENVIGKIQKTSIVPKFDFTTPTNEAKKFISETERMMQFWNGRNDKILGKVNVLGFDRNELGQLKIQLQNIEGIIKTINYEWNSNKSDGVLEYKKGSQTESFKNELQQELANINITNIPKLKLGIDFNYLIQQINLAIEKIKFKPIELQVSPALKNELNNIKGNYGSIPETGEYTGLTAIANAKGKIKQLTETYETMNGTVAETIKIVQRGGQVISQSFTSSEKSVAKVNTQLDTFKLKANNVLNIKIKESNIPEVITKLQKLKAEVASLNINNNIASQMTVLNTKIQTTANITERLNSDLKLLDNEFNRITSERQKTQIKLNTNIPEVQKYLKKLESQLKYIKELSKQVKIGGINGLLSGTQESGLTNTKNQLIDNYNLLYSDINNRITKNASSVKFFDYQTIQDKANKFIQQYKATLSQGEFIDKAFADTTGKMTITVKDALGNATQSFFAFNEKMKTFDSTGLEKLNVPVNLQSTNALIKNISEIDEVYKSFDQLKTSLSRPIDFKIDKILPEMEMLNSYTKLNQKGIEKLTQTYKLNGEQSLILSADYNRQSRALDNVTLSTGKLLNRQLGFNEMLTLAIEKFSIWIGVTTIFFQAAQEIRDAFNLILEQTKAFTNLQMEMTDTNINYQEITNTTLKYADALSSTNSQVLQAVAVFGTYTSTISDILEKSQAAIIMANITGDTVESSSNAIMATMSQFKLGANDAMSVVDKASSVARKLQVDYPIAVKEITSGMRIVGSIAVETGLSIDQLDGIMGTLIETTRRTGDELGNSMKTILQRMQRVGEDSDPETFKTIEKSLYKIGVAMKDQEGNIRPAYDMLDDIAQKWQTLTDVQRASVAQQAAGVRQINVFYAMMQNWDKVSSNVIASQNSEGVAMQKQEIFANQLTGALNRLENAKQKIFLNTGNPEALIGIVKVLTGMANGLGSLASKIGGIPAVVSMAVLSATLLSSKLMTLGVEGSRTRVAMTNLNNTLNEGFFSFNNAKNMTTSLISKISQLRKGTEALTTTTRSFAQLNPPSLTMVEAVKNYGLLNTTSVKLNSVVGSLGGGLKNLAIGFKNSAFMAGLLNAAMSIGWMLAISAVITVIYKAYDNWANRIENANNKIKELNSSINENNNNIDAIKKSISAYNELKDIVNQNTEQKEKFANALSKIAEIYPGAIVKYDAEGRAVEANTVLLQKYINLKEQENKYNQDESNKVFLGIADDEFQKLVNTAKRVKTLTDEIKNAQNIKDQGGTSSSLDKLFNYDQIKNADLVLKRNQEGINTLFGESAQTVTDFQSKLNSLLQTYSQFDNLDTNAITAFSQAFVDNSEIFENLWDSDNPLEVFSDLNTSGFTEALSEISDEFNELKDNTSLTTEEIEKFDNKAITKLVAILLKTGKISENGAITFVEELIKNLGNLEEKANETIKVLENVSFSSVYEDNKDDLQLLGDMVDALDNVNNEQEVSIDTIAKLSEAMPEFDKCVYTQNGVLKINGSILEDLIKTKKADMVAGIESQRQQTIVALAETMKRIGIYTDEAQALIDLANIKSPESANAFIDQNLPRDSWAIRDNIYTKEQLQAKNIGDLYKYQEHLLSLQNSVGKNSSGGSGGPSEAELYDTKDYELALAKLNSQMELLEYNKSKLVETSQAYRDVLQQEIAVNKQKQEIAHIEADRLREENQLLEERINTIAGADWDSLNDSQKLPIYNSLSKSSKTELNKLTKEFDTQKKSIEDLGKTYIELQSTIDKTNFEIVTSRINQFDKQLSNLKDDITTYKSLLDLLTPGTKKYNTTLQEITYSTEQQIKILKEKATLIQQELLNDQLTIVDKEKLNDTLREANKEQLEYLTQYRDLLIQIAEKQIGADLASFKATSDAKIAAIQSRIDAINEENQALEDQKALEEDLLNIANAEEALADAKERLVNAEKEKNVRIYQNGAWSYIADPKAVKDAKKDVDDANDDLLDAKEEYLDKLKELEDKAMIAALQAQIDAEKKKQDEKEKAAEATKKLIESGGAEGNAKLAEVLANSNITLGEGMYVLLTTTTKYVEDMITQLQRLIDKQKEAGLHPVELMELENKEDNKSDNGKTSIKSLLSSLKNNNIVDSIKQFLITDNSFWGKTNIKNLIPNIVNTSNIIKSNTTNTTKTERPVNIENLNLSNVHDVSGFIRNIKAL